eukprot:CAMPEP_0204388858 /NCGR_PEP_ID=MMETSP0469-20131031/59774_1 /ASSEMBLY_ACC=CAM_ASM_000384 /TAXON_ID=2969 /ORGANISM="Oxyrrhis marina" /LENGTH=36 /DNA_ID= /DNA_START= /DNA_END= /DNA_ORIENTATION=
MEASQDEWIKNKGGTEARRGADGGRGGEGGWQTWYT